MASIVTNTSAAPNKFMAREKSRLHLRPVAQYYNGLTALTEMDEQTEFAIEEIQAALIECRERSAPQCTMDRALSCLCVFGDAQQRQGVCSRTRRQHQTLSLEPAVIYL